MPLRKVSIALIPNRRLRATTFAKRKTGLTKKASELATLCGVRVAVVCAAADAEGGALAPVVWESEAGVLDAYRALPSQERARHTHRAYADLELRKEEARLVRARMEGPAALAPEDAAVYGLSLDEARRMLAAVDEALRAASERRAAVGLLPVDGDGGDSWLVEGLVAPGGAADGAALGLADAAPSRPFVESGLVSSSVDGGYLLRGAHQQQGSANEQQQQQQATWDGSAFDPRMKNWQSGYAFQQCAGGMVDTYGNAGFSSTARFPCWDDAAFHHAPTNNNNAVVATMMQPNGNGGFECNSSHYVGGMTMSSYLAARQQQQQQQAPSNAVVGYPPSLETGLDYYYLDGGVAQQAAQQGGGGGMSLAGSNFTAGAATALSLTMGTGSEYNLVDEPQAAQPLAMTYNYNGHLENAGDYASHWSSADAGLLHQSSAGSSQQSSNTPLWETL